MFARVRETVTVLSYVCLALAAVYVCVPLATNWPKIEQHAQVSTSSAVKLVKLYHFHFTIIPMSTCMANDWRRDKYVNVCGSYC